MTDELYGSTGSKDLDKNVDTHVVIVEDVGEVTIPGAAPLSQIVYDGRRCSHVADDDKGRWVYRPL